MILGGLLLPFITHAHVKWFVDTQNVIDTFHTNTAFYTWGSKEVLIWSLIVLATVLVFSVIDRIISAPKGLVAFAAKHEWGINRVAQAVLGLFLISVSFLWNIIIVPDAHVVGNLSMFLQYVQVVIGLMYFFNVLPKVASIGLTAFCVGLIYSSGFVAFLENGILLSLAVYFFIVNSKPGEWADRFNKHAVEIVRIGTGITLITLAFTEKFLYPELSLQFLEVHHWNFMAPLFPWFTNELFVLSTGFAETIFGILFIAGYITRITTVLIALFFGCSVVTMMIQSRAWEVEDLVVYSAAILFIFFGHGRTKFFHFVWPNSFLHRSLIKK